MERLKNYFQINWDHAMQFWVEQGTWTFLRGKASLKTVDWDSVTPCSEAPAILLPQFTPPLKIISR